MNEWVGKMLGKVRIDSLLARGGMAEVYLGVHTTLQREVAIKILRNQYEDDPALLERFQREARVVAKLRHQNIVQVFDYDAIDDRPYIVMEYISGPSLSKYLNTLHEKSGRLELPEINRIISGVGNALQYAHNSGVIHRDIKPGNIILTSHSRQITPARRLPPDFEPVLTDFGLVRFLNSSRQTSAGQTAGTPAYMSPEQARGEVTDGRTDIYSLGIVLYEMLTGNVPFDGETTMSILLKHISEPPAPIPGLSNSLQKVLDRALAKRVADRYQTPAEFANAFKAVVETDSEENTFAELEHIISPSPVPVADPEPSLIVVAVPSKPRRKWLPILLGVIAVALFGVIYFLRGSASSPGNGIPTASQTVTLTPKPTIPIQSSLLGSTAILHFRDGDAIMDQAFLEALAMPAPPPDTQYEVWLAGPAGRVSIGILVLDASGRGTRTYNASQAENLLTLYDSVEITIKPRVSANLGETDQVAYSYSLPKAGLEFVRQLLVSSPNMPDQAALIQSFSKDAKALLQSSRDMLDAYATSDQTKTKLQAESIINMIVGDQSLELHKDWNQDGQITDPGDGYGLLLNGTNQGHIRAIYAQADYAANSPDASQNMISHGSEVKTCAENLALWIPQLRELSENILAASSLKDMETPVRDAAALVEQIYNGFDANNDGRIGLQAGECGYKSIYSSAYAMADMPLLPVNTSGTPAGSLTLTITPTPTNPFSLLSATPSKSSGGSGGSGGSGSTPIPASTKRPPPGQQKPTKTPRSTKP